MNQSQPSFVANQRTIPTQPFHIRDSPDPTTLSCTALARPSTVSAAALLPSPPATRRRSPSCGQCCHERCRRRETQTPCKMGLSRGLSLKFPSEFLKFRAGCREGAAVLAKIGEPPKRIAHSESPRPLSHGRISPALGRPTPIQPFPNPDMDGINRHSTTTQPSFVSNPRTISTQPFHIRDSPDPTTQSCMALARPSTASAVASLPTPPAMLVVRKSTQRK